MPKNAFISAFRGGASGTNEISVYTAIEGSSYDNEGGEQAFLIVSKSTSVRYAFIFEGRDSFPPTTGLAGQVYTATASVPTDGRTDTEVAINLYNEAVAAGYNVSRSGAVVTFTASVTGNMLDAVNTTGGSLIITQGS